MQQHISSVHVIFDIFHKDTWKAFHQFKKKQEKCMELCFLICKSLRSENSFNTIYVEIKHECKRKNSFRQNKCYKNALFFLSQAPTHHRFTFNSQF